MIGYHLIFLLYEDDFLKYSDILLPWKLKHSSVCKCNRHVLLLASMPLPGQQLLDNRFKGAILITNPRFIRAPLTTS